MLASRRTLVLLDNCEHVIDACASLCHVLLKACPQLTVLATSREPLGVDGETTWRVPSMEVRQDGESLKQCEAVRLFVDRALRARPTFELGDGEAVAQICRRLDGIPLAIELAAARVRVMSPERIAAGLDDRFRLLSGGARTAVPRQRTLEASVDWSHNLLNDEQRTLFRRLSVFAGSFALDSAEAVCAGDGMDVYQVFDLLLQLVDRSLVQVENDRYRLLETIRQYGRQKLVDAGEADTVRLRHLEHYTELVERARLLVGSGQTVEWLERLGADFDNVRAALDWAATSGHAEAGLRLATAWPEYWPFRGDVTEGRGRIEALLDAADPGPHMLATALVALETVAGWRGADLQAALEYGERGLALAREVGDRGLEARALDHLGWTKILLDASSGIACATEAVAVARDAGETFAMHHAQASVVAARLALGDLERGRAVSQEIVDDARATGNLIGLTLALGVLGLADGYRGWPRDLKEAATESLGLAETVGDRYLEPLLRGGGLGLAAVMLGDHEAARPLIEDGVREGADTANYFALGCSEFSLSLLERAVGDADAALDAAERGANTIRAIGLRYAAGMCLAIAAWAADKLGQTDRAIDLLAAAFEDAAASRPATGFVLVSQALIELHRDRLADAEDSARAALAHLGPHALGTADAFELLGGILGRNGEHEEAARFFAAGQKLRDETGLVRFASDEGRYDADLALVREALGEDAFATAWAEGAAMSTEEAVAYATRGRGQRRRPTAGWDSLTPTELEVVRLLAQGLTNPQIGERLFISRGTVKTHLAHVFAKLAVSTRAELATEVTRRDV